MVLNVFHCIFEPFGMSQNHHHRPQTDTGPDIQGKPSIDLGHELGVVRRVAEGFHFLELVLPAVLQQSRHTQPPNKVRTRIGIEIYHVVEVGKPEGKRKKKKKKKKKWTKLAPIIKIKLPLNHVIFSCIIETGAAIAEIFKCLLVGENHVVAKMLPVVLVRGIVRIIKRIVVLHENLQEGGMRKKGGKKKKKRKRNSRKSNSIPAQGQAVKRMCNLEETLHTLFDVFFFSCFFFFFSFFFFFNFFFIKYNGGFSVRGRKYSYFCHPMDSAAKIQWRNCFSYCSGS
jgi:hypothetical protein